MLTADSLLPAIEAFLERKGISATAFGMAALGDPNFVRNLRNGREPRRRIVQKCEAFINSDGEAASPAESEAAS